MKNRFWRSAVPAALVVATLGFGLAQGTADDAAAPKAQPAKNQPARFNKATGIVGTPVLNEKGERLGEIKDLVFDLKTERVAYAVLGTDGQPAKLLAVPVGALTPSTNAEHLVLRAEKAKIDSAAGLSADNWPAPVSPVWGAQPSVAATQPAPRTSLPRR